MNAEDDTESLERRERKEREAQRLEATVASLLALAGGPRDTLEVGIRNALRLAQDRIDLARAGATHKAWRDMTKRFSYAQRQHLANLLAHEWTITSISVTSAYGGEPSVIVAPATKEGTNK